MKLTADLIKLIHDKKGIDPLSEDYPAINELKRAFGQNTFYLTDNGLHVWEYIEIPGAEGQLIVAVRVASWANDEKSDIALHVPQLTEITIKVADSLIPDVAVA